MALPERTIRRHLREQLAFIDSSCEGFDAGRHAECKRLATAVRVIVHDGPAPARRRQRQSKSLLTHLGVKEAIGFHDSTAEIAAKIRPVRPGDSLSIVGHAVLRLGGAGTGWVAAYELMGLGPLVDLRKWWTQPCVWATEGRTTSRRDVVDWLANKDGGAHIDDELPPTYEALSDGSALAMTFRGPGVGAEQQSPIPVVMRAIAEEVRSALRTQLPHLLA